MKVKESTLEIPFGAIAKPEPRPEPNSHGTSYPRDRVMKEAVPYFDGDELAAGVWVNKYALKSPGG